MMKKFLKKLTVMVAAISMAFAVPTVSYAYGTGTAINSGTTYTVRVQTGYLALRTAMAYDSSNEIGAMYTGETVQVQNTNTGTEYWYVYSPKLGKSGYCNSKYLVYSGSSSGSSSSSSSSSGTTYTVSVATGYLALRTAMAYDSRNEIGAMYSGETVQVQNTNTGTEYWYVYSPKLGKSGYCNSKYLIGGGSSSGSYSGSSSSSGTTYTVSVATGYLALRTAMAYDSRNEIGAMYSGETVQVQNTNTGTEYWYVYSPKLGKSGYCNSKYLIGGGSSSSSSGMTRTVRVQTGYLALRTAMAYDSSNEIGAMYTGETVQVQNTNTGTEYWYVYSPKLGKSGYCNSKYLY